jgi:hypothetical protein
MISKGKKGRTWPGSSLAGDSLSETERRCNGEAEEAALLCLVIVLSENIIKAVARTRGIKGE